MINPLEGVLLNGQFYNYRPGSFREQLPLKNTAQNTQTTRTFSMLGKAPEIFSIMLNLDTTYNVPGGSMDQTSWLGGVGETTFTGVSRLQRLKDDIGSNGASQSVIFVTPYGATYSVVPTGAMNLTIFNPDNPRFPDVELRTSLTLESV